MRFTRREKKRLADTTAASAALLVSYWSDWARLMPNERHTRIARFLEDALVAYLDAEAAGDPRPLPNYSPN